MKTALPALACALLLLGGSAVAQPQSAAQQRCITARNAGFAKVAKARGKALMRCAKEATKSRSATDCLSDAEGKLQKASPLDPGSDVDDESIPSTSLSPGGVAAEAQAVSTGGDSGAASASASYDRAFDATGDLVHVEGTADGSGMASAQFTSAFGEGRATTRVAFQLNEPVAYQIGWNHPLDGETGFAIVRLRNEDSSFLFARALRPVPNPDEQVGDASGVLAPGLYHVTAEARGFGAATTTAGGDPVGSGSASADFTPTLTPQ